MELLARVRIIMWEGASLWIVDATPAKGAEPRRTDFHAHHAIQVTVGLGGWFRLNTKDADVGGDAVAVAADAEHVFEAEGLFALVFIEPESRAGRAVARRRFNESDLVAIPSEILGDRASVSLPLIAPPFGTMRRSSPLAANWWERSAQM